MAVSNTTKALKDIMRIDPGINCMAALFKGV